MNDALRRWLPLGAAVVVAGLMLLPYAFLDAEQAPPAPEVVQQDDGTVDLQVDCSRMIEDPELRLIGSPPGQIHQLQEIRLTYRLTFEPVQFGIAASDAPIDLCGVDDAPCTWIGEPNEAAGSNAWVSPMKFDGEQIVHYRPWAEHADGTIHVGSLYELSIDQHDNWSGAIEPCDPR